MAPSLQDIADQVGVSKSLVSKVLNDRLGTTRIGSDLRARIVEAARKTGYRKNLAAEALSSGRQNTVGVFIEAPGTRGSGIVESLIDSLSAASLSLGKKLLMSFFRGPGEFEPLRALMHRNIMDGAIVCGVCHPQVAQALIEVRRGGLPVVTAFKRPLSRAIPNVGVRQEEITRIATEHLIGRGCRRIAHIHNTDERLEGYRRALQRAGLPFVAEQVFEAAENGFTFESGTRAVARFIASGVPFDGIVAQSDAEAVGAINALHAAGRRVPQDVRVTGVDDAVYCRYCIVPISSVSERVAEQGDAAMRLLDASLRGEPVETQWLDPRLVVRASSI